MMGHLLIVSHTEHYHRGDHVVGWGATIREIDHLATRFQHVTHIAPLHPQSPPASARAYTAANITHIPVPPAGGPRLPDKLAILARAPHYLQTIRAHLPRADVLHLRLPANISALALLTLGRAPARRWFKYAGAWHDAPVPLSYRLQRWLLAHPWHGALVTINGTWPNQPPHVHSLYNPSLTTAELAAAADTQKEEGTLHILFAGRVERAKGAHLLPAVAHHLREAGQPFHIHVAGPLHEPLPPLAEITTYGALPRARLNKLYARAHILLHPSLSEGWPKVISEGFAYGVVPVASAVGAVPQTLTHLGVGRTFPPGDAENAARAILTLDWRAESVRARQCAALFTYQHVQNQLMTLLKRENNTG